MYTESRRNGTEEFIYRATVEKHIENRLVDRERGGEG